MSLPTAHSYILRELKNIDAMHAEFLKPEALIQHISNIETMLNRISKILILMIFQITLIKKKR